MNRIICVGNRLFDRDSLGPRVFDVLARRGLPTGLDVVDGGLAGLDLLSHVDGCERVVFVDTIAGGSGVQVLCVDEVERDSHYGHGAGLAYVLGALRALGEDRDRSLYVVGAGTPENAEAVAEAAITLACGGEILQ